MSSEFVTNLARLSIAVLVAMAIGLVLLGGDPMLAADIMLPVFVVLVFAAVLLGMYEAATS